jgi:hypothetical protein
MHVGGNRALRTAVAAGPRTAGGVPDDRAARHHTAEDLR